jgi:hypothetical protein
MLNVINNPVGIDIPIKKLQAFLHDALLEKWGIETDQYQSYGRCYRNKQDKGYMAEVYDGNDEYKEVYYDDTISAISFFGISNNIKQVIEQKADVHLIFFVNLEKLKPEAPNRADEEVRIDVMNIIGKTMFGFTLDSVDLWLENVLREYSGSYREERLKQVDMHPVHCFRLNFTLNYNIKKPNCP